MFLLHRFISNTWTYIIIFCLLLRHPNCQRNVRYVFLHYAIYIWGLSCKSGPSIGLSSHLRKLIKAFVIPNNRVILFWNWILWQTYFFLSQPLIYFYCAWMCMCVSVYVCVCVCAHACVFACVSHGYRGWVVLKWRFKMAPVWK